MFGSTPFNFRIHGPLPDCWRFTEHGLRALLKEFEVVELNQVDTPERELMPMHYTFVAKRPGVSAQASCVATSPKCEVALALKVQDIHSSLFRFE